MSSDLCSACSDLQNGHSDLCAAGSDLQKVLSDHGTAQLGRGARECVGIREESGSEVWVDQGHRRVRRSESEKKGGRGNE